MAYWEDKDGGKVKKMRTFFTEDYGRLGKIEELSWPPRSTGVRTAYDRDPNLVVEFAKCSVSIPLYTVFISP